MADEKEESLEMARLFGEGEPEETEADPNLPGVVAERLKQYYDQRLSEPLPDKFASLLQKLSSKSEAPDE